MESTKVKIEIKSWMGKLLFTYESENNNIAKTVRAAVLSNADLSNAVLRGAVLRGAVLDKTYIQISRIGSANRTTTYCQQDNIVWCGCFTGTLEEFEAKVKNTHEHNEKYLKQYLGFIAYLRSIA